tara:strand:+ start:1202 stop:2311 length:1110 start_codon:yes stop_codon:yes gene_type:complete
MYFEETSQPLIERGDFIIQEETYTQEEWEREEIFVRWDAMVEHVYFCKKRGIPLEEPFREHAKRPDIWHSLPKEPPLPTIDQFPSEVRKKIEQKRKKGWNKIGTKEREVGVYNRERSFMTFKTVSSEHRDPWCEIQEEYINTSEKYSVKRISQETWKAHCKHQTEQVKEQVKHAKGTTRAIAQRKAEFMNEMNTRMQHMNQRENILSLLENPPLPQIKTPFFIMEIHGTYETGETMTPFDTMQRTHRCVIYEPTIKTERELYDETLKEFGFDIPTIVAARNCAPEAVGDYASTIVSLDANNQGLRTRDVINYYNMHPDLVDEHKSRAITLENIHPSLSTRIRNQAAGMKRAAEQILIRVNFNGRYWEAN